MKFIITCLIIRTSVNNQVYGAFVLRLLPSNPPVLFHRLYFIYCCCRYPCVYAWCAMFVVHLPNFFTSSAAPHRVCRQLLVKVLQQSSQSCVFNGGSAISWTFGKWWRVVVFSSCRVWSAAVGSANMCPLVFHRRVFANNVIAMLVLGLLLSKRYVFPDNILFFLKKYLYFATSFFVRSKRYSKN